MIRPETRIDLHGCRQHEALEALEALLSDALQRGYRMVLIIHGQGYRSQSDAVLKPLVQRWLAKQPQVLAWCPALARDGAAGASYVYLRNS
jgi:DNA-nicking Smr family endonuclease